MPVPIYEFRRWFANQEQDVNASDLEGTAPQVTRQDAQDYQKEVFVWLGKDSKFAHLNEIKPGNTIVLPVTKGGWNELGHVPDEAEKDCGDRAQWTARHRLVLRLHPKLIDRWPAPANLDKLKKLLNDPNIQIADILDVLFKYQNELTDAPAWFLASLGSVAKQPRQSLQLQEYPNSTGLVLSAKRRVHSLEEDDGSDAISSTATVLLEQHLADVEKAVGAYRDLLPDKIFAYEYAARLHDYGKADIRFQTLLRNGDGMAARLAQKPLAKSSYFPISRRDRQMYRQKCELPDGFRHELLSLLFAQDMPELSGNTYDLVLHLIATHHGYCRPFAPIVIDQNPPNVSFQDETISGDSRQKRAPHRLDSGIPDRFWRLIHHFGWWGLAYQEALFRLADWEASARETKKKDTE
jgi:CRISPR-associated endonuclease/helicase Cas3